MTCFLSLSLSLHYYCFSFSLTFYSMFTIILNLFIVGLGSVVDVAVRESEVGYISDQHHCVQIEEKTLLIVNIIAF